MASAAYQHIHMYTGEEVYRCTQCGTSFKQLINLKHHQLTHTGEKSYNCDYCAKGFVQKDGLNRHIKNIHNKEIWLFNILIINQNLIRLYVYN